MYYRSNRDFPPFDNSHGLMRKSTEFHSHEIKQNAHEVTPWAVFQGGWGDTYEGEGGSFLLLFRTPLTLNFSILPEAPKARASSFALYKYVYFSRCHGNHFSRDNRQHDDIRLLQIQWGKHEVKGV